MAAGHETKDSIESVTSDVHLVATESNGAEAAGAMQVAEPTVYRTYKRRWFGLLQLVLLNLIVSWDVSVMTRCLSRCQ